MAGRLARARTTVLLNLASIVERADEQVQSADLPLARRSHASTLLTGMKLHGGHFQGSSEVNHAQKFTLAKVCLLTQFLQL